MLYQESLSHKRNIDCSLDIVDVFVTKNQPLDCVVGYLKGSHGPLINTASNKYYYVLEGNAKFVIDQKSIVVQQGDFIHISPQQKHLICGNIKFLLICSPPYNSKNERTIFENN